jgi:hypothetical protein
MAVVLVTITYTIYAHRQWQTMQRQLELSGRAWVGLAGDIVLTRPPHFQPGQPGLVFMGLGIKYAVKNFGKSPAINEVDSYEWIAAQAPNTTNRPERQMNALCSGLEDDVKNPKNDSGNVVFPNSSANEDFTDITGMSELPADIKIINRLWIIICIVYRDDFGIHQSRFWLRSNQPDITVTIPATPGRDLKWSPFDGFQLWNAQAN